jgi:hypothetical protein
VAVDGFDSFQTLKSRSSLRLNSADNVVIPIIARTSRDKLTIMENAVKYERKVIAYSTFLYSPTIEQLNS